jgi:hypothetical protein
LTDAIQVAIDSTQQDVERTGDSQVIDDWNGTKFIYDPGNSYFDNSEIGRAAFRDPNGDPMALILGDRLAHFLAPGRKDYHNATFQGGELGLHFVILHEFGHVFHRNFPSGNPTVRERLANESAYFWLVPTQRRDIKCIACRRR